MVAYALLWPATAAFVSLSQASLMDLAPARRESNMARWELAGAIGFLIGPLLLSGGLLVGAGWRGAVLAVAVVGLVLAFGVRRAPFGGSAEPLSLRDTSEAVRSGKTLRWLVLLEASYLAGDVFSAFVALDFVDEAGLPPAAAAASLALWAAAGIAGDALLIFALRLLSGLAYVRLGALAAMLPFRRSSSRPSSS